MKNNFRTLLTTCLILITTMMTAQTVTFTAAEIVAGSTKNGVTVSVNAVSSSNKQICKEGSTAVKVDCASVSSSADSAPDTKNIQISTSTGEITGIDIHGASNNSGVSKGCIITWTSATPDNNNVGSSAELSFPGNADNCTGNVVSPSIPAGTKSLRLYRRIKMQGNALGSGS
ncbi:MAG TPA: hypothetical protein DEO38_06010, partial [Bacteroidales bacterium]|nr:hypothetical protein [Bacteroidales bacterium]